MACCSYEKEKSDLLGSNFPLWCWRMLLCKPVVGVCFLGWDLWLWALDVYVGDWLWRGVDWPEELLLAGGRHCWQLGSSAEIYSCESGLHRQGADPCESVRFFATESCQRYVFLTSSWDLTHTIMHVPTNSYILCLSHLKDWVICLAQYGALHSQSHSHAVMSDVIPPGTWFTRRSCTTNFRGWNDSSWEAKMPNNSSSVTFVVPHFIWV